MNLQIHGKTCVDTYTQFTDVAPCGKPSFRKTHGWLCIDHYRDQQTRIPAKPRKRIVPYRGVQQMTDEQIVADIIRTELVAIADSDVRTVRYGSVEPSVFKFVSYGA